MSDRHTEERLTTAFGEGLTSGQRAWLDARVTATFAASENRRSLPRANVARTLILVGLLLLLAPIVFAVAAGIISTEGPYGMGDADAYDAELNSAKAVTPIPPDATWPPYLDRAEDRSASYGTGLGTQMVELNAYCLWLGYWYDAQRHGDSAAVTAAVAALDQTRGWRTFSDPLLSDEGFRAIHADTIDSAIAGDASAVLRQLELNCTGTWRGSE